MVRALEEAEAARQALRHLVAHDRRLGRRDVDAAVQAGLPRSRRADADRRPRLERGDRHRHDDRRRRAATSSTAQVPAQPDHRASSPRTAATCVPGSGEIGLLAVGGDSGIPLGYYKDDGEDGRHVQGDRRRALLDPRRLGDASRPTAAITLLGRGSVCINTGGEKVFPGGGRGGAQAAPGGRGLHGRRRARRELGRGHRRRRGRQQPAPRPTPSDADRLRRATGSRPTRPRSTSSSSSASCAVRPARPTIAGPGMRRARRSDASHVSTRGIAHDTPRPISRTFESRSSASVGNQEDVGTPKPSGDECAYRLSICHVLQRPESAFLSSEGWATPVHSRGIPFAIPLEPPRHAASSNT